jgi:hypothetical protein
MSHLTEESNTIAALDRSNPTPAQAAPPSSLQFVLHSSIGAQGITVDLRFVIEPPQAVQEATKDA